MSATVRPASVEFARFRARLLALSIGSVLFSVVLLFLLVLGPFEERIGAVTTTKPATSLGRNVLWRPHCGITCSPSARALKPRVRPPVRSAPKFWRGCNRWVMWP